MQTFPLIWIPLVPLLGAAVLGILGNRLGRANINLIACGSILTALAGSLFAVASVAGGATLAQSFTWFHVGTIDVSWGFTVDRLSATLLLVVTGIGFLIHVYSTGYMAHDPAPARYFAYLNLFVSAMLVLVLGDNLVVLFVGWEGVGLCSYLLIGFWYEDPDKALAGRKAFIVNRIGDLGFTLAVFACIAMFGTVSFHGLAEQTGQLRIDQPLLQGVFAGWGTGSVITLIGLLFLVGVAGKSAQIPLYVWLPDAMAGPTPVSALIHAATMVTAGVYLMCRLSFLYVYSGTALTVVGAIGAATALFAAIIACAQNDIKKVLAYSTVSQLGFMVLAVGVGAFWAAIAHLVTHAFFKACLFLTAGSVIHGMHDEQDVRRMGGLLKRMPQTGAAFIVATAAITGVVPLSGFFSKDAILSLVQGTRNAGAPWAPALFYVAGSLAALGTAYYMWRLALLTFYGQPRTEQAAHAHEATWSMTFVTWTLAAGSVAGLWLALPLEGGAPMERWLAPVFEESLTHLTALRPPAEEGIPWLAFLVAFAIAWAGAGIAYVLWRDAALRERATRMLGWIRVAAENKFYVDEIYQSLIVRPIAVSARFLWRFVDQGLIDGVAVRGSAAVVQAFSRYALRPLQNGNAQSYAMVMALGMATLLWLILKGHA